MTTDGTLNDARADYTKALDRLRQRAPGIAAGFPRRSGRPSDPRRVCRFRDVRRALRGKLDELASVRRGAEPFVEPQTKRVTVGQLLDALQADLELRDAMALPPATAHMRAVRDVFGHWRAIEVTPEAVDQQIERWLGADMARATINRRVQVLGQAFRFGHRRHRVASVPTFRHLTETNTRQGFFSRPTFEAAVKAPPEFLRDVALFGYQTGWRRGEIVGLTAANVDMKLGERIGDSKNGDGRVIPLRNEDGTLNAVGEIVERRARSSSVAWPPGCSKMAA